MPWSWRVYENAISSTSGAADSSKDFSSKEWVFMSIQRLYKNRKVNMVINDGQ